MICVVLCAGYATRMHPLTLNQPKALLEIKGRAIIDCIIDNIPSSIDKIYVITNDKFYSNFAWWLQRKNSDIKDKIEIVNDGTNSNENRKGGIADLWDVIDEKKIDDDILVVLGDNLFSFSLNEFVSFFESKEKTALGVIQEEKEKLKNFGVVEIEEGKITSFEEKPKNPKSDWISTGLYIFSKEDISKIKDYMKRGLSREGPGYLIKDFLKDDDVYAFKFYGNFYDIGSIEEYERLK